MLPLQLLESLINFEGFDKEAFEKVHASGDQITSVRLNPLKNLKPQVFNNKIIQVPWTHQQAFLRDQRLNMC